MVKRTFESSIRVKFFSSQKEKNQSRVRQAADYILHQKPLAEKRIHTKVRSRTFEAYGIADSIYKKYRDTHSLPQIENMVKDALSSASWDNQKGYYFVQNTRGILLFNRNNPDMEGREADLLNMSLPNTKGTNLPRK